MRKGKLRYAWLRFVERRRGTSPYVYFEQDALKSPLVIVLVAVVLVTVGTLAVMNNACKSSQHVWCAPMSTVKDHIRPPPRQTSTRGSSIFG